VVSLPLQFFVDDLSLGLSATVTPRPTITVKGADSVTSVHVDIDVPKDDVDTRVAILVASAAALAGIWFVFTNIGGVVRRAADGERFDRNNPRRLRSAGLALLGLWLVSRVFSWVATDTIDARGDFKVVAYGPGLVAMGIMCSGLFALAAVFERGLALRELEQSTV
jgi:hypothetical protein